MRLHPREELVNTVEVELGLLVGEFFYKGKGKGLTRGEALRVIVSVFSNDLASTAKYMIREKRHPGEPDRPGGLG